MQGNNIKPLAMCETQIAGGLLLKTLKYLKLCGTFLDSRGR